MFSSTYGSESSLVCPYFKKNMENEVPKLVFKICCHIILCLQKYYFYALQNFLL